MNLVTTICTAVYLAVTPIDDIRNISKQKLYHSMADKSNEVPNYDANFPKNEPSVTHTTTVTVRDTMIYPYTRPALELLDNPNIEWNISEKESCVCGDKRILMVYRAIFIINDHKLYVEISLSGNTVEGARTENLTNPNDLKWFEEYFEGFPIRELAYSHNEDYGGVNLPVNSIPIQ